MLNKQSVVALCSVAAASIVVASLFQPVEGSVQVQLLATNGDTSQDTTVGHFRVPSLRSLYHSASSSPLWALLQASNSAMPRQERLALLKQESEWKNSLVTWALPQSLLDNTSHFMQTWIRCFVLAITVYLVIGSAWCWYGYVCFGDVLYKPGTIPRVKDMLAQVQASLMAMPLYSLLPTITEWAAENGYTKAYPRVGNVGVAMTVVYFCLYMTCVEFGVYWMHRGLHYKWAYRLLHRPHHVYNKEHTLSPFAGLAFNPLDGIMQALPYSVTLLFCPMHFLTHELLLFATGVWTTNIHDCVHGKMRPIMGAGYHTIHHTAYRVNYGHYFTFMDQLFGTLVHPEDYDARNHEQKNN